MNIIRYPNPDEWDALLKRPTLNSEDLNETVREILNRVRTEGDKAVRDCEEQFDKVRLDNLQVTPEEFDEAEKLTSIELKAAILLALNNIKTFHSAQRFETKKVTTLPGVTCWQKAVAIEKVGLYIPGGMAPLFSTVLMLATPAQIAGCKEIILCTPPDREGKIHPAILYAAKVAGVTRVFKIGGVQAIGAMAYGTTTVPKVYKIFGPGNQYVTAAKQQVSLRDVAIDMPAGPSEVAVLADETANPTFVAADLLSQAEHGRDRVSADHNFRKPVGTNGSGSGTPAAGTPAQGNSFLFTGSQQTDSGEEHGRSSANGEPLRSRTPDHRNQRLRRTRRKGSQCRIRISGFLLSRKCRRLCIRHEPHASDQRLCPRLQRCKSGQLYPEDHFPGSNSGRNPYHRPGY